MVHMAHAKDVSVLINLDDLGHWLEEIFSLSDNS
jgi:hypothetical protein